ncbi:MAG: asparaginase [Planctomycetota bacterium]|jgi:L-asparaginase II|nr:asparaginase [Planctomycetota bacterium]MDP6988804.1 asparaginase [Planctomycetota bacterium]
MTSSFPENPALVRARRGGEIESQHRGAWVLVDTSGAALEGAGAFEEPVFARSSVKAFQALPLVESGAAERFAYGDAELALALSSHNAEAVHTDGVRVILDRLGLSVADLQCGAQQPSDPGARAALRAGGEEPTALHNNCSGKHAGFLALTTHLGASVADYLDPDGEPQLLVRQALADMSGVDSERLWYAIDGCSAPTWRLPLAGLATAFARVANPEGLQRPRRDACIWMQRAVAAHPGMIAGEHQRLCTDLARVTEGRLFPKIGAEGVYGIGVRGGDRGLAVKMDDGVARGLHAVVIALLERFGFATRAELDALAVWRGDPITNWAGQEVGSLEVVV